MRWTSSLSTAVATCDSIVSQNQRLLFVNIYTQTNDLSKSKKNLSFDLNFSPHNLLL